MTVDPVSAFGETLEELKDDSLLISVALTKPVLDVKIFDNEDSIQQAIDLMKGKNV